MQVRACVDKEGEHYTGLRERQRWFHRTAAMHSSLMQRFSRITAAGGVPFRPLCSVQTRSCPAFRIDWFDCIEGARFDEKTGQLNTKR